MKTPSALHANDSQGARDEYLMTNLALAITGLAGYLLVGLDHLGEPARRPGLAEAQLATVGVHREVALVGQVVVQDETHALTLGAEPGILQAEQYGNGVAVVDLRRVHVGGLEPGHGEGAAGSRTDRGFGHVGRIAGGLVAQAFSGAGDTGR